MTVRDNGVFDGVLRLADGDEAFHGALTVLGSRTMRYDGTFGDGTATLTGGAGERTLRLVPDGEVAWPRSFRRSSRSLHGSHRR